MTKMEPSFLEKITLEIPRTQCDFDKCVGEIPRNSVEQEFRSSRIFQSRKRNFNEIFCEDRSSKKVHGMPGVRLQQEKFQFYF